ncbi:AP-1-like transcription factor [Zancudomyces culisetae]|uniref:AP-1-like transcription factor n=1 Tax=Zancudomyces culisetae TaxID=1213189 RepID=A0A1R1PNS0_ZANCU|nr:AP-1-like transcription factor [Zancudomyces culisetae]|eukprot:OMH82604.1 AP-1-like transcription factor [Zancudomyces culisetae]
MDTSQYTNKSKGSQGFGSAVSSNASDSTKNQQLAKHELDNTPKGRNRARSKVGNTPEEAAAKAERNRAAQRAFRQRREQYVKELEFRSAQYDELQTIVHCLSEENQMLRMRVETLTHHFNTLGLPLPPMPPINRPPTDWAPLLPPPPLSNIMSRRPGAESLARGGSQPGLVSTNTHSPNLGANTLNTSMSTGGVTSSISDRHIGGGPIDDKSLVGHSQSGSGIGMAHSSSNNPEGNVTNFLGGPLGNVTGQLPLLQGQQGGIDFQNRSVDSSIVDQQSRNYMYQSPGGNLQGGNSYNPFNERVGYQQVAPASYMQSNRYANDIRMDMRYGGK